MNQYANNKFYSQKHSTANIPQGKRHSPLCLQLLRQLGFLLQILLPARAYLLLCEAILRHCSPLASLFLRHFIAGTGHRITVNAAWLLEADEAIKHRVLSCVQKQRAAGFLRGKIRISQSDYSSFALRLAFGSVEAQWHVCEGKIAVTFNKRYSWSPFEPRVTQGIHRAAARLEKSGSASSFEIRALETRIKLPASTPSAHGYRESVPECSALSLHLL